MPVHPIRNTGHTPRQRESTLQDLILHLSIAVSSRSSASSVLGGGSRAIKVVSHLRVQLLSGLLRRTASSGATGASLLDNLVAASAGLGAVGTVLDSSC